MHLLKSTAVLTALIAFQVPAAEQPVPITPQAETGLSTATARMRTIPREYRLDGVVEAVNRTTVSAQTQGQVEEILYDVDDFVNKGVVIARIKDTEHRTRVAQAAADLKAASAQLQQARDEQTRIKGLYEKKNASESAMDQATANLASAQAALEAATARLEQAKEQLEYTQIRAPYSGIVTHRHVQLGEMASPGQPVMSGISLDQLRVSVDVPQSVIPAVRGGRGARVYLPAGRVIETGEIIVFPFADLESNTFKVRVELPAVGEGGDEGIRTLFPGMFVKIGFVVGEKEELTVPRSAVVQRSEVTGVYVVLDDGHLHFRQVRLGRALEDAFVVLAGLKPGEQVALDPIAATVRLKSQDPMRHPLPGETTHD